MIRIFFQADFPKLPSQAHRYNHNEEFSVASEHWRLQSGWPYSWIAQSPSQSDQAIYALCDTGTYFASIAQLLHYNISHKKRPKKK